MWAPHVATQCGNCVSLWVPWLSKLGSQHGCPTTPNMANQSGYPMWMLKTGPNLTMQCGNPNVDTQHGYQVWTLGGPPIAVDWQRGPHLPHMHAANSGLPWALLREVA